MQQIIASLGNGFFCFICISKKLFTSCHIYMTLAANGLVRSQNRTVFFTIKWSVRYLIVAFKLGYFNCFVLHLFYHEIGQSTVIYISALKYGRILLVQRNRGSSAQRRASTPSKPRRKHQSNSKFRRERRRNFQERWFFLQKNDNFWARKGKIRPNLYQFDVLEPILA